jgi:hypothetical protein
MAEADSPTTSIGRTPNGKPPTVPLKPALTARNDGTRDG